MSIFLYPRKSILIFLRLSFAIRIILLYLGTTPVCIFSRNCHIFIVLFFYIANFIFFIFAFQQEVSFLTLNSLFEGIFPNPFPRFYIKDFHFFIFIHSPSPSLNNIFAQRIEQLCKCFDFHCFVAG